MTPIEPVEPPPLPWTTWITPVRRWSVSLLVLALACLLSYGVVGARLFSSKPSPRYFPVPVLVLLDVLTAPGQSGYELFLKLRPNPYRRSGAERLDVVARRPGIIFEPGWQAVPENLEAFYSELRDHRFEFTPDEIRRLCDPAFPASPSSGPAYALVIGWPDCPLDVMEMVYPRLRGLCRSDRYCAYDSLFKRQGFMAAHLDYMKEIAATCKHGGGYTAQRSLAWLRADQDFEVIFDARWNSLPENLEVLHDIVRIKEGLTPAQMARLADAELAYRGINTVAKALLSRPDCPANVRMKVVRRQLEMCTPRRCQVYVDSSSTPAELTLIAEKCQHQAGKEALERLRELRR